MRLLGWTKVTDYNAGFIAVLLAVWRKLCERTKTWIAAIGITQTHPADGLSCPVLQQVKQLQAEKTLERIARQRVSTHFPWPHLRFWIQCFESGSAGFG